MNDEEAAKAHRLAQARRLIDLFQAANGRHARTMKELEEWVASPEGQSAIAVNSNPDTGTIDPYD